MRKKTIALLGSPNVGKTSLFNRLTKLNQKVGNYPGVTVEKREGMLKPGKNDYRVIDLPGVYSIYPSSIDEKVVFDTLVNKEDPYHPDAVLVIAEPSSIKRSITLYHQVREMNIPAVFVVNMIDESEDKGVFLDQSALEQFLQAKVFLTDARNGRGVNDLVRYIENKKMLSVNRVGFDVSEQFCAAIEEAKRLFPLEREYTTWLYLAQEKIGFVEQNKLEELKKIRETHGFKTADLQRYETNYWKKKVEDKATDFMRVSKSKTSERTKRIDRFLMHPLLGYLSFLLLLLLIFQAIFAWSAPFMDFIDESFGEFSGWVAGILPEGMLNSLLTDGIISGIGGIVVFVPQIVILFLFLSLLEESGYMSRVVFLMDRWLSPFGLNGKSVVPLMSGAACAIPAVMSARNIENPKERLLTMLVTPFMACSARLPIYIVIIGLVIPDETVGMFNLQGLALFIMYMLGVVAALGSAWILNKVIKSVPNSYLVFEIPTYKMPYWRNVLINVWEKASGFIVDAGKIILTISIILWALGSFGPNERFSDAESYVTAENPELAEDGLEQEVAAYRLEHSFLGYIGRAIEPVVVPLGYDWKMGIGIITSFAAREVFVGTMAVVYSLGDDVDVEDDDDKNTLLSRMKSEINRNTGEPAYNFASGISLLVFYAFAMQCMATIAIVKKETGSWKWTLFQLIFMTGLAYALALLSYQLLK